MIDFWDIIFDNETLADNEDFIEGIIKLGFEKKVTHSTSKRLSIPMEML
jgi:hypothetical protein